MVSNRGPQVIYVGKRVMQLSSSYDAFDHMLNSRMLYISCREIPSIDSSVRLNWVHI